MVVDLHAILKLLVINFVNKQRAIWHFFDVADGGGFVGDNELCLVEVVDLLVKVFVQRPEQLRIEVEDLLGVTKVVRAPFLVDVFDEFDEVWHGAVNFATRDAPDVRASLEHAIGVRVTHGYAFIAAKIGPILLVCSVRVEFVQVPLIAFGDVEEGERGKCAERL